MKRSHIYSIRAGYLAVAAVCQVVFSNFPAKFFAFPVNAAIWLLVAGGLWVLQHEKKQTPFANCWVPPPHHIRTLGLVDVGLLSARLLPPSADGELVVRGSALGPAVPLVVDIAAWCGSPTGTQVDYYPDRPPKNYEAQLTINGNRKAALRVNHPYHLSLADDLYLAS